MISFPRGEFSWRKVASSSVDSKAWWPRTRIEEFAIQYGSLTHAAVHKIFDEAFDAVSGGVKGATAGTLAFMVGGEDEAVERARPVLEPLAGKIIHCGASGTGQAAKLCNNMVLAVQQIADLHRAISAFGVGLAPSATGSTHESSSTR